MNLLQIMQDRRKCFSSVKQNATHFSQASNLKKRKNKKQKVKYTLLTVNKSWATVENKTRCLPVVFSCFVPVPCQRWIPWCAQVFCKHRWASGPFFTCRTSKLLPGIYSSASFFFFFFIIYAYTKAFSSSWLHFLLTEGVLDVAVTFDADDARQCLEAQLQQRHFVSISAEEENSLDLTTYLHCTSASHWRCKKMEKNTW